VIKSTNRSAEADDGASGGESVTDTVIAEDCGVSTSKTSIPSKILVGYEGMEATNAAGRAVLALSLGGSTGAGNANAGVAVGVTDARGARATEPVGLIS
jgi:hypothetical protein